MQVTILTEFLLVMSETSSLDCTGGIISIKEARKLLGAQYSDVPDDVILSMIVGATALADALLDWRIRSTKCNGVI